LLSNFGTGSLPAMGLADSAGQPIGLDAKGKGSGLLLTKASSP